jgi:hypothetical protein
VVYRLDIKYVTKTENDNNKCSVWQFLKSYQCCLCSDIGKTFLVITDARYMTACSLVDYYENFGRTCSKFLRNVFNYIPNCTGAGVA